MEELGRILKKTLVQKSTSANTGTSPNGEQENEKCPVCKGHGWLVYDLPVDHPDFGRSFPCKCTLQELASGQIERLERYSNLGPLTRLTFSNFKPTGLDPDPARQSQYHTCFEKARVFAEKPSGWLVITGPSGCGKTHLAAAIANHCIKIGIPTFWTIVPDLLDHLRATFSPSSDVTYDELFERVKNAALLVLDDLGTHSSTPWAEEKLFQVLNHRFNAQLPTIVTAISLNNLDQRLQTRLLSPGLSIELNLKTEGPAVPVHIYGLSEEELSTMRFRNFDIRGMNADREQRESLKTAFEAARQFADSPEDWLIILGPVGVGKTHLAASVANRQIDNGRPVIFASVPELLDRLRISYSYEGKKGSELSIEAIKTAPLLIFDDFNIETASAWAREKIYQILNYRYTARLATLITATNPAIDSLDAHLQSRLMDPRISNVVPIGAPDYRRPDKQTSRSRKGRSS